MKRKWYLRTWLICLMFALWPLKLFLAIGLVLLYMQYKEQTNLYAKYSEIDSFDVTIEEKLKEIHLHKEEINALQEELAILIKETVVASYNLSNYEGIASEECKNRLTLLEVKEQELVKNDKAVKITSTATGRVLNNNIKQLLRCFNAECDNILLALNAKNIDMQRGKIKKCYDTLNNIFSTDGLSLTDMLLEIKLEQLNLVYTYKLKKEQEKEQQREIRERMAEEENVRKEIEYEKQKIEKEELQFRNEIKKLTNYLQRTDDEVQKNLYIDKIKELQDKLELLEKDKENILQREQNTRAGFVYVISNIGSFGEDVYKIGMTRRLEPLDRVRELSNASVPFSFDVHAMIFSEDAPTLEAILHQKFREYELNKVNSRKEFFKVPLPEIEKVVKDHYNSTVTFTLVAKALEYRESLKFTA